MTLRSSRNSLIWLKTLFHKKNSIHPWQTQRNTCAKGPEVVDSIRDLLSEKAKDNTASGFVADADVKEALRCNLRLGLDFCSLITLPTTPLVKNVKVHSSGNPKCSASICPSRDIPLLLSSSTKRPRNHIRYWLTSGLIWLSNRVICNTNTCSLQF